MNEEKAKKAFSKIKDDITNIKENCPTHEDLEGFKKTLKTHHNDLHKTARQEIKQGISTVIEQFESYLLEIQDLKKKILTQTTTPVDIQLMRDHFTQRLGELEKENIHLHEQVEELKKEQKASITIKGNNLYETPLEE